MKGISRPFVVVRRLSIFLAAHVALFTSLAIAQKGNPPAPLARIEADNMSVTASARFAPGEYRVADSDDNGVLQVEGDDITLDFQGATLIGAQENETPDRFSGIGIVAKNSKRLTIKNLRARGFKFAVLAENCQQITLENLVLSDNFKQHLQSTPEAENGADWLFGHENDAGEWRRYGAAAYLDGCQEITVRSCVAKRGQNGLCLTRCQDGQVYDCDMSFNSGWGIALYRSKGLQVAHCKFDWCIRGYSHGVYNRGQDSAGIFVFEQSSNNYFAHNSATHCGDGFFLFAGLETLEETGLGGCNDNLVYGNDFSHASNNGIEATFSRGNRFIENIMDQADHAVWAGYSHETKIEGNRITRCNHGVSIEHGSATRIEGNTFEENGVAVNLWSGEQSVFASMPYGRFHHLRSEKYEITKNTFRDNRVDAKLSRVIASRLSQNEHRGGETWLESTNAVADIRVEDSNIEGATKADLSKISWGRNWFARPLDGAGLVASERLDLGLDRRPKFDAPAAPGSMEAFLPEGTPRGLDQIFVDEWGPYDFREPIASPKRLLAWNRGRVRLLGPRSAKFAIPQAPEGIDISPREGTLPATLEIAVADRKSRDFEFEVELPETGEKLRVEGCLLAAKWQVSFYRWPSNGPHKPPADWPAVLQSKPLEEMTLDSLDFRWGGGAVTEKVGADQFATLAETEIELPAGRYRLRTVSDDGVRVTVDDQVAIENWTWHGPTEDTAEVDLPAGKRRLKVEHFEIDGVAQLQFWIEPVK